MICRQCRRANLDALHFQHSEAFSLLFANLHPTSSSVNSCMTNVFFHLSSRRQLTSLSFLFEQSIQPFLVFGFHIACSFACEESNGSLPMLSEMTSCSSGTICHQLVLSFTVSLIRSKVQLPVHHKVPPSGCRSNFYKPLAQGVVGQACCVSLRGCEQVSFEKKEN